jgi:two-component system, cell cycle response regulator
VSEAAPPGTSSIVVVEDDPSTARLLAYLLTSHGYQVRLAESLASGRAELARMPADLVILDRNLPDGDGLDLAREIKVDGRCYVMMLTSLATDQAKLDGFEGGADDYVTKPFTPEELLARIRAGLRIIDLQKALIASNRRLELLAATDALTGVRNRRWFDEELERSFAHALRYERPLSLAMIDIDHFKRINDAHGHLAGDRVLRGVSRLVASMLRKSDLIARVGGEEFAILLPESGLFEALQVAEKVRARVSEEPIGADLEGDRVTISVGVASIPHTKVERSAQFVWCADQALYRAKNRGRDRVELERRSNPWRTPARAESASEAAPRSALREVGTVSASRR